MDNLYLILKDYLEKSEEYAKSSYDLKIQIFYKKLRKRLKRKKNY